MPLDLEKELIENDLKNIKTNFIKMNAEMVTEVIEDISPKQSGNLSVSFIPSLGSPSTLVTESGQQDIAEAQRDQAIESIKRLPDINQDLYVTSSAPYAEEVVEEGSDVSGGDFGDGVGPGWIADAADTALLQVDEALAPSIENPALI